MREGGSPATFVILLAYAVIFFRFDLITPQDEALRLAGWVEVARVATGEPWRLLAAQFAHIGLMHLLFNAYFLWSLGPWLERQIGTPRFVVLYVLAGILGNVACCLWYSTDMPVAGGSTSLFGFLGAILAIILRQGRSLADFWRHPMARSMLGLVIVNVVIGFLLPFISQTGHLGGLVGGFLVAFFLFKLPEAGRAARFRPALERLACVGLFAGLTALALWPVHRTWFMARDLWLHAEEMPEERVDALREALELRSLSSEETAWLARSGKYRGRLVSELLDVERRVFERGYNLSLRKKVGLDPGEYNLIVDALNLVYSGNRKEADMRIPLDFWRAD